MTTDIPPSVKDRPDTVILQTGSDVFSRETVVRALQTAFPTTYQHLILNEPTDGYYFLTTMEPKAISVDTLVTTTLCIGARSITMIDMAHRQISPVVELKLIGVFSNPGHSYDHVASALQPFGTILQAEFPRIGTSAMHEDALEVTLALNEKRTLPPRILPIVSPAPHFFKFSSRSNPLRFLDVVHLLSPDRPPEDCTAVKSQCRHCHSTAHHSNHCQVPSTTAPAQTAAAPEPATTPPDHAVNTPSVPPRTSSTMTLPPLSGADLEDAVRRLPSIHAPPTMDLDTPSSPASPTLEDPAEFRSPTAERSSASWADDSLPLQTLLVAAPIAPSDMVNISPSFPPPPSPIQASLRSRSRTSSVSRSRRRSRSASPGATPRRHRRSPSLQ